MEWLIAILFALAVVMIVLRFLIFGTPWRPDSPYRNRPS